MRGEKVMIDYLGNENEGSSPHARGKVQIIA